MPFGALTLVLGLSDRMGLDRVALVMESEDNGLLCSLSPWSIWIQLFSSEHQTTITISTKNLK